MAQFLVSSHSNLATKTGLESLQMDIYYVSVVWLFLVIVSLGLGARYQDVEVVKLLYERWLACRSRRRATRGNSPGNPC